MWRAKWQKSCIAPQICFSFNHSFFHIISYRQRFSIKNQCRHRHCLGFMPLWKRKNINCSIHYYESEREIQTDNLPLERIMHTPRTFSSTLLPSAGITIVTIIFALFQWLRLSCFAFESHFFFMFRVILRKWFWLRFICRYIIYLFAILILIVHLDTSNGLTHQLQANQWDLCHKKDWTKTGEYVQSNQQYCLTNSLSDSDVGGRNIAIGHLYNKPYSTNRTW